MLPPAPRVEDVHVIGMDVDERVDILRADGGSVGLKGPSDRGVIGAHRFSPVLMEVAGSVHREVERMITCGTPVSSVTVTR